MMKEQAMTIAFTGILLPLGKRAMNCVLDRSAVG
jgi:hypothetical protein